MRISDWSSDVCSSDLLDHITSSGLGLDDTSMFEANSFATSQLIRRRQAASWACSEATNESVCAFIGQSIGCATLHPLPGDNSRSEEHTSELQSLMRISYAVFCLKKKNNKRT